MCWELPAVKVVSTVRCDFLLACDADDSDNDVSLPSAPSAASSSVVPSQTLLACCDLSASMETQRSKGGGNMRSPRLVSFFRIPFGFSCVTDTGDDVRDPVMTSLMTTRLGLSSFWAVISAMADAGRMMSWSRLLGESRAVSTDGMDFRWGRVPELGLSELARRRTGPRQCSNMAASEPGLGMAVMVAYGLVKSPASRSTCEALRGSDVDLIDGGWEAGGYWGQSVHVSGSLSARWWREWMGELGEEVEAALLRGLCKKNGMKLEEGINVFLAPLLFGSKVDRSRVNYEL